MRPRPARSYLSWPPPWFPFRFRCPGGAHEAIADAVDQAAAGTFWLATQTCSTGGGHGLAHVARGCAPARTRRTASPWPRSRRGAVDPSRPEEPGASCSEYIASARPFPRNQGSHPTRLSAFHRRSDSTRFNNNRGRKSLPVQHPSRRLQDAAHASYRGRAARSADRIHHE